MKWAQVQALILDAIKEDAQFPSLYQSNIRMGGTQKTVAPVLEMWVIGDGESELWSTVTIQFDQWCLTMDDLVKSEQRLRRKFHRDLPVLFDEVRMWCQYLDGASLASPDRDSYFARAIRFRFTPLRDRYQPSPTP